MTKRDANRGRRGQRATITANEHQALVDQERANHSIAERLAEEARLRFRAEIDVPRETGVMVATQTRRRRRATTPKPVRQVARAACLSLRKLADAVMTGQPSPPEPTEHLRCCAGLPSRPRTRSPASARASWPSTSPIVSRRWRRLATGPPRR